MIQVNNLEAILHFSFATIYTQFINIFCCTYHFLPILLLKLNSKLNHHQPALQKQVLIGPPNPTLVPYNSFPTQHILKYILNYVTSLLNDLGPSSFSNLISLHFLSSFAFLRSPNVHLSVSFHMLFLYLKHLPTLKRLLQSTDSPASVTPYHFTLFYLFEDTY